MFAGWPDYPWASMFALVTIICVLALEHLVSRAYERRMTKQLSMRPKAQGAQLPFVRLTTGILEGCAKESGRCTWICRLTLIAEVCLRVDAAHADGAECPIGAWDSSPFQVLHWESSAGSTS